MIALRKKVKRRNERGRQMKKNIFLTLLLLVILSFNAYALDTTLMNMRDKFFSESLKLKEVFPKSKDMTLLVVMWDSCLNTASQLDGYFYMLGIFNTIKEENLTKEAIDFLFGWLGEIRKTAEMNLASLNGATGKLEPDTKVHIAVLKDYFAELIKKVDLEAGKISALSSSVKNKGA